MKYLIVLFCVCNITFAKAQKNNDNFLTQKQLKKLYKGIIEEIEYLDAEGIDVRNRTKTVNWNQYKKFHKKKFIKSKSFKELEEAFNSFGDGFVCGHSDFDFIHHTKTNNVHPIESDISIGFTYPEASFFELNSKKTIKLINGKPINKVFEHFLNYQTSSNTLNDCQNSFVKKFEKGNLSINGEKPKLITYEDNTTQKITYSKKRNIKSAYEIYSEGINLDGKYNNWKRIEEGYKVALLQKANVALVKIKNFIYFKGRGGKIKCQEKAKDSTHCGDVQVIRKGLKKIADKTDYLIIDLQDNPGGQENTRFLSELCPNEFYDLRVQYKKTELLKNTDLRAQLFYNSKEAENWYQNLLKTDVYSKTKYGDFLPVRADFCRGDSFCKMKPIIPNGKFSSKFKKIIVLVNEGTASSADDFAFRMKEYGNALIAGQPQSADLTYSLVSILFYLDSRGNISKTYLGNRQRDFKVDGIELLKFSVPYSKTVDKHGKLLQGSPLKLDIEIPVTKSNFEEKEENVLQITIEKLLHKNNKR